MTHSPASGISGYSRRSGRLLTGAIALGLAVTAGPLAVPAAAGTTGTAAGTATAATTGTTTAVPAALAGPAAPAQAPRITPGSEIVSAGTTGFLSVDARHKVLWTRYADGVTTELAEDYGQFTLTTDHGTASDTVALGNNAYIGVSDKITLRDMASGKSTLVDLTRYGYRYAGTVGAWVVAVRDTEPGGAEEAHLLGLVGGELTDRTVSGLPSTARDIDAVAGASGAVLLRYQLSATDTGLLDHAVVDLESATVTTARGMVSGRYAATALSATHMASAGRLFDGDDRVRLAVATRGAEPRTWSMDLPGVYDPMVGLVGKWALYGSRMKVTQGSDAKDMAFRAVPIGGGAPRTVLDHATSLAPAPDGSLLVTGGTVEHGEGVYRVTAGADGAPVAQLVASTGEPTKVTVLDASVPAVAELDKGPWRPRWLLSRVNVEVTLTLRHTASGAQRELSSYPDRPDTGADWVAPEWDGLLRKDGVGLAAPNGAYTWTLSARPLNGIGPDLTRSGTFTVSRGPAPHDYTDNGSPDLLVRDEAGWLSRQDTFHDPADPRLRSRGEELIGRGWEIYDRIVAAGNVAGAATADVVARDTAGVLWLYLGKGDGTFDTRVRIGSGWEMYDRITGGGDVTGDGLGDVLARDRAGVLWLYRGTGSWKAPFAPRVRVGSGWDMYNEITSVGDVAGAPGGDLVARDAAGVLWLYLGKGDGTFDSRVRIGSGWDAYRQMVGIGDANADGRADLFVTAPDGNSYVYRGTGNWRAPFAPRELTDVDTPTYKTIA
ncbi:FG-GAP repeat domain-containing protein [Streptomyces sp. URMC 123]|uniref:FG-GAP repeat domain-containing protein n=1 Tax=Streptomyces sp. URMC 123 TaxID=3423403 RepID=UPI003F1C837A